MSEAKNHHKQPGAKAVPDMGDLQKLPPGISPKGTSTDDVTFHNVRIWMTRSGRVVEAIIGPGR